MQGKPFVLGVTGGSASGKTHFLRRLLDSFSPEEVCLISQDHYYKPIHEVPKDPNGISNFDVPQAIDVVRYRQDIQAVQSGLVVQKLEYTFNNPSIVPQTLTFKPSPIILLEGLFVFYAEEISSLIDLKVFIDAREHVKLRRRIVRDAMERGYDLDDVLYRYEHHVSPTYDLYVEPFKHEADLIIPNNKGFDRGLEVLVSFLKERIRTSEFKYEEPQP